MTLYSALRILGVGIDPERVPEVESSLGRESREVVVTAAADVETAADRLATSPVDAVICGTELTTAALEELLDTLETEYPSLPVVVLAESETPETLASQVRMVVRADRAVDPVELAASRTAGAAIDYRARTVVGEAETRYGRLLAESPVPIVVFDLESAFLTANDRAAAFFGVDSPEDLEGRLALEFVHEDARRLAEQRLEKLTDDREGVPPVELKFETPGGETRYAVVSTAPVEYRGEPACQAVLNDVTDYKRTERELRRERATVRGALDAVEDVYLVTDEEGQLVRWNDSLEATTGLTAEALTSLTVPDLFDPEDVPAVRHAVDRALAGERVTVEASMARDDDTTAPFEVRAVGVEDEDGEAFGVVGLAREVTDRRRREAVLESLHDATRRLFAADDPETVARLGVETAETVLGLPIAGVWLYDEDRGVLYSAAETETSQELLSGSEEHPPEESLAGEAFLTGEVQTFEDVSTVEGALNPSTPVRGEMQLPLGDHGVMNVGSMEPGAFDDEDVNLARILAANVETALDLAVRESELRASERRFRDLAETSYDVIFRLDPQGRFTYLSPAAERIIGRDPEELVGEHFQTIVDEEGLEEAASAFQRVVAGSKVEQVQVDLDTPEGGRSLVEITAVPVEEDGELVGVQGTARDVTAQVQRESLLAILNRVLRHNLRNETQVVMGHATRLYDHVDRAALGSVDEVQAAAQRLFELGEKAIDLQKAIEDSDVGVVDVGAAARSVVETARREHPDAEIDVEVSGRAVAVAHPEIDSAIAELVENAAEHAGDEPSIRVSVVGDWPMVRVCVEDDGPGIPENERSVLQSGEETPLHHGIGLGLWLVYWIVTTSGGEILLSGDVEEGCTVDLLLPAAEPETRETE